MMALAFAVSSAANLVLVLRLLLAVDDRRRAREELADARTQNRLLRQELAVRVSYH